MIKNSLKYVRILYEPYMAVVLCDFITQMPG